MISLLLALAAATAASGPATHPDRTQHTGPVYVGRDNQLRARPVRLEEAGHTVDGALSEPQWAKAALLTGFSQFSPNDGVAASDSTQVLVWYSPTAIHFGIRAYEAHGAARGTLADRDRIAADDHVQLLLGTFNDGRQATVFAVNPLGVQADGIILESNQNRTGGFGQAALARDPADLSPDFVFQSKGRLTADGYVIEVRIPFKSLKYQSAEEQTWGLNVVRQVQHSGHEDSWTPAKRAGLSFLRQSGTLEGLSGLRRGLVVDVNPELTQRTIGRPPVTGVGGAFAYDRGRPEIGGNARWGITNNITLNGTVNPDFSQVESDAGQLSFDPRQALFFAEKRPFFLDGIEQFATPRSLVYTRRIVQPVAAAKLTGKVSGTNVAFLTAVDDAVASATRQDNPVFNLLRVQRDIGTRAKLGALYTDRVDGQNYNRVADVDGSTLFGGIYSLQGQYAHSFTRQGTRSVDAPLWQTRLSRNGRNLSFNYYVDAVHEDFRTASGFISRPGVVNTGIDHRYTWFGKPGALFSTITMNPALFGTWRYRSFVTQGDAIEKKAHLNFNTRMRGGWNLGLGYLVEVFGYDPALYAGYRILRGVGDTVAFTGTDRIPNNDWLITFGSPSGRRVAFNLFYVWGRDENFFEWASSDVVIATYGLTVRPTDKLRLNATYNLQSYNRRSDGSIVGNTRLPRLKMEYQIARPLFVRVVGEYASSYRDALRDESRTGRPIIAADQCNGGVVGVTRACQRSSFRSDVLVSYTPSPGTVVFLGYGAGYADTRLDAQPFEFPSSLGFRGYNRTDDALFVKASYLFRL